VQFKLWLFNFRTISDLNGGLNVNPPDTVSISTAEICNFKGEGTEFQVFMKKIYLLFVVVLVLNLLALLITPPGKSTAPLKNPNFRVGLVFDVGGRGDKSFNDSAYRGLQQAEKELGIKTLFIEPGEGADREAALRMLAAQNYNLVIGVGFIFTDDLNNVAAEYPKVNFAGVDYVVKIDDQGREVVPPNLMALKFREEEGSFLVGALAALMSKSNRIGFVGGMKIPLIERFEMGFLQGAKTARPDVQIVSNYAGVTGAAFKDPARGKELATTQYGQGVDIIYHASGSTGLGVFEAARNFKRLAIGVDSDQYSEAPGFILTSMVKRVDVAIFEAIQKAAQGQFKSGVSYFGLKENGVDFVYDQNNKALIPDPIYTRVQAIRTKLVGGEIKIGATP
jgi:basic membrane protein A